MVHLTSFDRDSLNDVSRFLSFECAQLFMHRVRKEAVGNENTTEAEVLRQQSVEKRKLVQILFDGVNHFVALIVQEDGSASLYDSAAKKVTDGLTRQLRFIFGNGKQISVPPLYPQAGNNCLVNAAAIAADFAFSKKNPHTAQWQDGVTLRQWFNRILFNESVVSSGPRKRGVRSSEATVPPDALIAS